jgi:thiopeptide-type bacteriocin biosynthesis protein
MIDSLLSDLLFTVEQKHNLMEKQSTEFKKEFGFHEFNTKQFNTKYRDCIKTINDVIKEKGDMDKPLKRIIIDINKRSTALRPVFLTIIQKCKKHGIDYLTITGHYIHMMLNRLFYEKARIHELLMYDFLRRYYASEIARARSENTVNAGSQNQ